MTSVLSINTSYKAPFPSSPTGPSPLSSPTYTSFPGHSLLDHPQPPHPSGGILLNKITLDPYSLSLGVDASGQRRASGLPDAVVGSPGSGGGKFGIAAGLASLMSQGSASVPLAVALPNSPALTNKRSSLTESPHQPLSATLSKPPKPTRTPTSTTIRFAPLPIPRRQRALSTGRNVQAKASLTSDGTRRAEWQAKIDSDPPWTRGDEDDEQAVEDDSADEREDNGDSKMSWKDMGTWAKPEAYTKLLKPLRPPSFSTGSRDDALSRKESNESIDPSTLSPSFGAPLKKSISTGGLIGSSPFRFTSETDRRRSLVGIGSSRKTANKPGRRGSSVDKPDFSSLSASLGRSVEEVEEVEPGSGKPVRMLNGRVYGSRRASLPDKPAEPTFNEWNGMMGGSSSGGVGSVVSKAPAGRNDDDDDDGSGMGWVKRRREAREKERRESEMAMSRSQAQDILAPIVQPGTSQSSTAPGAFMSPTTPTLVVTQTDHEAVTIGTSSAGAREAESSDEEEDDGDGDHDFESDDEDEILEEEEKARTTSSAAGVEVISRHKD